MLTKRNRHNQYSAKYYNNTQSKRYNIIIIITVSSIRKLLQLKLYGKILSGQFKNI